MRVRRWSWRTRGLVALVAAGLIAVTVGTAGASAMSGGDAASPPEARWMATLAVKGDKPLPQRASCGGALVAPDKVLTAAHCLAGISSEKLRRIAEYHIGARVLSRDPGVTVGIKEVAIDPRFRLLPSPVDPDDPAAGSATYDDAVVTLDRPVRGVRPLPIARTDPPTGTVAALYGHGITAPGSGVSDELRRGLYRVTPNARCERSTPATVDAASMRCGRPINAEACTGDSGGPWVSWNHGRAEVVGVFSFGMETAGQPCGAAGPNFFTSTAATWDWLSTQT